MQSRFQLVLSAEQRQQIIALTLLTAPEPLVLNQLQQDLAVARATVLKDLETVEPWFRTFSLMVARRQHRGCWIEGDEFAKRQALAAMLWGDVPFERPLCSVQRGKGLVFSLSRDARLLPAVAHIDRFMQSWNVPAMQSCIVQAETALGGQYTDEAVLALQLALAVQVQRARNDQTIRWSDATMRWVSAQPLWPMVEQIGSQLWPGLSPDVTQAEAAALAIQLLSGARDTSWRPEISNGIVRPGLIEHLLEETAATPRAPELAHDQLLREGLHVLILPASVRLRFGLWMPPRPASDVHTDRYNSERALAQRLANLVFDATAVGLPADAIDDLTLLLRAAVVRARPEHARHVLVVCPSGIATTQLLLARLKARFPRLGTFEVLPMRELTEERVASADLILTTVPLPPAWSAPVDIIHVHPMLKPEDVAALTQWMA